MDVFSIICRDFAASMTLQIRNSFWNNQDGKNRSLRKPFVNSGRLIFTGTLSNG